MDLLDQIMQDIEKYKEKILKDQDDSFFMHFGIGMYIRNQYLWHQPKNIQYFEEKFGLSDPDDISHEILRIFIEKNSSKN